MSSGVSKSIRNPKVSPGSWIYMDELRLRGNGQICPENTNSTLAYKGEDGNMYVPDPYGRPSPLSSVYYRTPACQSASIQVNLENDLVRTYHVSSINVNVGQSENF